MSAASCGLQATIGDGGRQQLGHPAGRQHRCQRAFGRRSIRVRLRLRLVDGDHDDPGDDDSAQHDGHRGPHGPPDPSPAHWCASLRCRQLTARPTQEAPMSASPLAARTSCVHGSLALRARSRVRHPPALPPGARTSAGGRGPGSPARPMGTRRARSRRADDRRVAGSAMASSVATRIGLPVAATSAAATASWYRASPGARGKATIRSRPWPGKNGPLDSSRAWLPWMPRPSTTTASTRGVRRPGRARSGMVSVVSPPARSIGLRRLQRGGRHSSRSATRSSGRASAAAPGWR